MAGLVTQQPFKGLYALFAIAVEAVRLPIWILSYIPREGRPHRSWSFRQALAVRILKAALQHFTIVQVRTPIALTPGSEGNRFVVIQPAAESLYTGPLADRVIRPVPIGGTWTPSPPSAQLSAADKAGLHIIFHLHGGAYVVGDGRDRDTAFLSRTLLKHAAATHVFTPQYRLSSLHADDLSAHAGNRFPAALQDALSAYAHLVHTLRVPAARITLSGDSAGGNLALALLRYIGEHGAALDPPLPWPGATLLWSPWLNLAAAVDPASISRNPNYPTDYLVGDFGAWGARAYTAFGTAAAVDPSSPYVTPLGHAFECKTPLWIHTGDAEVLCRDDCALADEMRKVGDNVVELSVMPGAPHDVMLTGQMLGWDVRKEAEAAGEFVKRNRRD